MREDPTSILSLVRSLLNTDANTPRSIPGRGVVWRRKAMFSPLSAAMARIALFVALNFASEPRAWSAPPSIKLRLAISTYGDRPGELIEFNVDLRANEGVVIETI